MSYELMVISEGKAESMAFELFGIKGKAKALPGELDFNFRIKVEESDGYILKISRPDEDVAYLDFQQRLMLHVAKNGNDLLSPYVFPDKIGKTISEFEDELGNVRRVRLLTWVSGRVWGTVNPQKDSLRYSLGEQCGKLTEALQGFDHPIAHRKFHWDVAQALWTKVHIGLFEGEEKEIISFFQEGFKTAQPAFEKLRKSVVHNDANDHNVIVTTELIDPMVKAIIDYGDAVYTQVINDVAIACAYAIMHHIDPLDASLPIVKGYHASFPLEEQELEHLYLAIAMRLVISVTKSAINKLKEPENEYLMVSEKAAWKVLKKWHAINPDFAHYSFRHACGYNPHPEETKFHDWAHQNHVGIADLFPSVGRNKIQLLDLSISCKWMGHQQNFENLEFFNFKVDQIQKQHPEEILAGGYLEPRTIYTTSEYDKIGNSGRESRNVHLGLDFWLPPGTPVHALFDGEVVIALNDAGKKKYGGLVILKHVVANLKFYSMYGHLSLASLSGITVGQQIIKGECIGYLGNPQENGNWVPHLHFQIMLSMLGYENDFPGVAYYNQIQMWKSICPDPNLLFKSEALMQKNATSDNILIKYRKRHLGKSLSLQYQTPIKMVRGSGQYLIDQYGRKYLDTVNNVAHVGHEHPSVVMAGQEQMALINTNTRYLHDNIIELAKEILETLPKELSVLHFVNSGSEANELAMRMVKAATGERDIIASEMGYHGNSNLCIDISSYKFDGKGGQGAPEHTHIFPLPDAFRGKYRGNNTGEKYAKEVQKQIDIIHSKKRGAGAFIIEPIISCGGQIELPNGFLKKAYNYVRAVGGLCISDEVQVGCGRLGKTFWGFQLHDVVPDIVTIGKPLGNGHPLAAVACTEKVAGKFANGMEYFNTFGGNPVSCAIGKAVLQTVKTENLQNHAFEIGKYLKAELRKLAKDYPIIGDVRGQGLFLGFELVDTNMMPLEDKADYLVNRMKEYSILMSTDGPDRNVLKIKPPLIFTKENAKELIFYLKKILAEDFMNSY